MTRRDLHVRALSVLLLLVIAASTSAPAPCAMSRAQDSEPHGCCADGLSAAPPPCCHAQPATRSSAIVAGHASPATHSPSSLLPSAAVAILSATRVHPPATAHLHGPPTAVLRI